MESRRSSLYNQSYFYRITGVDSGDTNSSLSGNWVTYGSLLKYISLETVSDQKTEGSESIKLELYTDSGYNKLVASSSTILNDTSTLPSITITGPSESNEGDRVTWNLNGLVYYGNYYYRISGIDGDDTNSSLTNNFRSYGSSKTISITTLADQ